MSKTGKISGGDFFLFLWGDWGVRCRCVHVGDLPSFGTLHLSEYGKNTVLKSEIKLIFYICVILFYLKFLKAYNTALHSTTCNSSAASVAKYICSVNW